jgi:hypothetical protein
MILRSINTVKPSYVKTKERKKEKKNERKGINSPVCMIDHRFPACSYSPPYIQPKVIPFLSGD